MEKINKNIQKTNVLKLRELSDLEIIHKCK